MRDRRFPRQDYEALSPYDPGRRPVAVDLTDNTNLWGPSPSAIEVIQGARADDLRTYPSVYAEDLKEAIAEKFGISKENVTTGCGSDGVLDAAFRAATLPPGGMTYPVPSFSMVEAFGRMNGLSPRKVPWPEAERDPDSLLADDPALVYVCRPNNPTGATLPDRWIMDLLDAAGPEGPLVVVDEAYADFAEDNLLSDALSSQRLLILRTFSKLYGLAGLRVGFGIGVPELIQEMEKSRGPYRITRLAEAASVAAIRDPSGWPERIVEETLTNRRRLSSELEKRGFKPLPSQGNFLLIPLEGQNAGEVNEALRTYSVAARPFTDLPEIGDALRVTVGPWNLMEGFLGAMDLIRAQETNS